MCLVLKRMWNCLHSMNQQSETSTESVAKLLLLNTLKPPVCATSSEYELEGAMGIDVHVLNFLRYISRKEPLGRVATIGRQLLMVAPARLAEIMELPMVSDFGMYSEELLKLHFGANLVDSYDYSDYEGATFTADMNKPLVPTREYDTVIDCGSLEHIYNVPQAMANISLLCSKGGKIVHISPGNNFCGHGFWQFSPELFFSLYSEANGYDETQVFLADLKSPRHWFEVEPPTNGRRAEVISKTPLYVMCRARKIFDFCHDEVQQSDYVYEWQLSESKKRSQSEMMRRVKQFIRNSPNLFRMTWYVRHNLRTMMNPTQLSNLNPHLRKRDVAKLLIA